MTRQPSYRGVGGGVNAALRSGGLCFAWRRACRVYIIALESRNASRRGEYKPMGDSEEFAIQPVQPVETAFEPVQPVQPEPFEPIQPVSFDVPQPDQPMPDPAPYDPPGTYDPPPETNSSFDYTASGNTDTYNSLQDDPQPYNVLDTDDSAAQGNSLFDLALTMQQRSLIHTRVARHSTKRKSRPQRSRMAMPGIFRKRQRNRKSPRIPERKEGMRNPRPMTGRINRMQGAIFGEPIPWH